MLDALGKLNIKKEYIMPLCSLMLVGTALILATIIMFNSTLGWLAKNDQVSGNGMAVSTKGVPDTEVYLSVGGVRVEEDATNIFAGLVPGENVTFSLHVNNLTDEKIGLKVLMEAPEAEDDTVYEENGLFHYFGSQLRLNSIMMNEADILTLTGNDRYLLTLDELLYTTNGQPTAINSEFDFSTQTDKELTDLIEIEGNGEIELIFTIEFVDNHELQNAYIQFGDPTNDGKKDLRLLRTLICDVVYVN